MNECQWCGRPKPEHAWRHKWVGDSCNPCYQRWRYHGFPPEGPPANRDARLEDYAELRSWGEPKQRAAERIGVSVRTVERYKRALSEAS